MLTWCANGFFKATGRVYSNSWCTDLLCIVLARVRQWRIVPEIEFEVVRQSPTVGELIIRCGSLGALVCVTCTGDLRDWR